MRRRILLFGAASVMAMSAVAALGAQRGDARPPRPANAQQDAPAAGAQAPEARRRGGPPQGGGRLGARLDLTEDQRAKIAEITRTMRDRSAPLADELTLARRNLHRELFADERDASRTTSLIARVTDLEKQLLDLRTSSQAAIAGVLTAEQRATVRAGGGRGAGPQMGPRDGRGRPAARGMRPARPGR